MPRKSKATLAAEAAMQEEAPAPARRGRPPRASKAAPKPAEAEDGSAPSLAADAEAASGPEATGETPTEYRAAAEAEPAAPSKPAAQWDAASDTVQFDWPEIEQTASRPGPNQVMAKLLVAARAEGAKSRWPFQAA